MSALEQARAQQQTGKARQARRKWGALDPAHAQQQADAIGQIWAHPLFQESLAAIEQLEKGRPFCGHGLGHLLDVARIAYIENLERGLGIQKRRIYAAALLHDIGRHLQATEGIAHHEASAQLAGQILADCAFSEAEILEICAAIRAHRSPETAAREDLCGLIYRADKRARCCFACQASPACNWADAKKNHRLLV